MLLSTAEIEVIRHACELRAGIFHNNSYHSPPLRLRLPAQIGPIVFPIRYLIVRVRTCPPRQFGSFTAQQDHESEHICVVVVVAVVVNLNRI